jgi:hypothetical protein
VCVVTGASRGIGRETAVGLARQHNTVVMVARDTPGLSEAAKYAADSSSNTDVHVVSADLSRMGEVRRLAGEVISRFPRVDVLIHAAAIILPKRRVTPDGFEATFATNVMAPFLLTHLLLGALRSSAPSRVLLFYGGGRAVFDLDDLMSERHYDGWTAYNQTNVDGLLERIEHEVGRERRGDPPADNAPREDIDHERHIDEAAPRGDVVEVRHPELVRPRRGELAIDEIGRPHGRRVGLGRGLPGATPHDAPQPQLAHQALDRSGSLRSSRAIGTAEPTWPVEPRTMCTGGFTSLPSLESILIVASRIHRATIPS